MYTLDLQVELDRAMNYFFSPDRWGDIVVIPKLRGDVNVTAPSMSGTFIESSRDFSL